MAASDHLSGDQFLYHGTAHPFSPGDVVEPGHPSNWGSLSKPDRVSATTSRAAAHDYASTAQKMQRQWHDNPDAKGRVYRVEPVGGARPGSTPREHVATGFRVLDEGEPVMYPGQLKQQGIT
jgi:hypothetical protein